MIRYALLNKHTTTSASTYNQLVLGATGDCAMRNSQRHWVGEALAGDLCNDSQQMVDITEFGGWSARHKVVTNRGAQILQCQPNEQKPKASRNSGWMGGCRKRCMVWFGLVWFGGGSGLVRTTYIRK
jgi:hypothetical protein